MIFVVVLWLAAIATGIWAVWPTGKRKAAAEPAKPVERVHREVSLEGVLAGQLLSGEITSAQYRRAVEGVAARDELRHPMSVPGDEGLAG